MNRKELINKVIKERYRIIDVIDDHTAPLCIATDTVNPQRVLLKLYFFNRVSQLTEDKYLTEVMRFSRLSHQNWIKILNAGCTELYDSASQKNVSVLYVAMEYSSQDILLQHVKPAQTKSDRHLAVIRTIQILQGLQHANDQNVICGCLSPRNIVLHGDTVKIMKHTMTEESSDKVYASPEQLLFRSLSARSDVYCAGALLYFMLFGRPLYSAVFKALDALKNGSAAFSRAGSENLPVNLKNILFRALDNNPERRFQSAQEMIDALTQCLQLTYATQVQPSAVPNTAVPVQSDALAVLEQENKQLRADLKKAEGRIDQLETDVEGLHGIIETIQQEMDAWKKRIGSKPHIVTTCFMLNDEEKAALLEQYQNTTL